jgi:hypothetical protein
MHDPQYPSRLCLPTTLFHEETILFFSHVGSFAYLDENLNTIGVVEDTLDELEASLGELGKWAVD